MSVTKVTTIPLIKEVKFNIKNCPMCASLDVIVHYDIGQTGAAVDGTVVCNGCGVRTREFTDVAEAIASWNVRLGCDND